MIIAFDVSHIQTRRAGIGRYSVAILEELIRVDRVNHYVLHGWSFSLDQDFLRGLDGRNVSLRLARIPGPLKRWYWDRLSFPPLERFIGRCDIFHSADASVPPVSSAKIVLTVHDVTSITHPEYHERWVVERDRRLLSRVGKADAVIVPSAATRDALIGSGACAEDRVHVYTHAVPSLFTREEAPGESSMLAAYGITRPYILFVGTLEPRKNIQGIVRAFDLISDQRGGDIDLVLAGKTGWKSEALLAEIARARSSLRIRRLEYIPDPILAVLYRHALCLVYPSFAEGYGSPVAEAICSGAPVVTSFQSPMAEIASEAALLVDPRSDIEIAGAVLRMISSQEEHARWKLCARERAKELRGYRASDAILSLYAGLVES